MTKDELLSRIRELEEENQRLRESLEHTNQLLNEAIKGLKEWNEQFWGARNDNSPQNLLGRTEKP